MITVASLQLKIDAAEKDVARARSAEERATSERERQENLMKLSRSRCETLEREMRSSASTARQAQQAGRFGHNQRVLCKASGL